MRTLIPFVAAFTAVLAAQQKPAVRDPDRALVKSEKQTFRFEVIASGLETPWGLAFLPDGRLLITERPGRLRVLDKGGRLLPPVSGIPAVWTTQDGGLFDVEVHPDYARNGWIYLSYAEPGPADTSMTTIVRGKVRDNAWVEQQSIYKAPPELYTPSNIHYGSRFVFDRSGHLFYSIGDRGHKASAQELSSPFGKIHRVRDDGSVPADNPFAKRAGAVGSIWSYGHRNPQGLAFDPTGQLWATEHGPRGGDELNRIDAGQNYGWAVVSNGFEPEITRSAQEGMRSPVAHWTPAVGPSGVAFYSGRRYPDWRNSLFVTCLAGQQVRRIEVKGDEAAHQEIVFNEFGRVRDIAIGPDDLFYVALNTPGEKMFHTTPGVVVRLVPVP